MHAPGVGLWPHETTALQALGEQTQSVAGIPQQFDAIAAPAAKHEDVAAERIGGKGGGHARLTELGRRLAGFYRCVERSALADFEAETAEFERRLAASA